MDNIEMDASTLEAGKNRPKGGSFPINRYD